MELRYYQKECRDAVLQNFLEGRLGNLCVEPTGAGKSAIMAAISRNLLQNCPGAKILYVSHRKELDTQNAEALERLLPGTKIGFEKAQTKCAEDRDVMFASVLTVGKSGIPRIRRWTDPKNIIAVFFDEAHHLPGGKTYKTLLEEIQKANPRALIVGLTATPERLDGERIGDFLPHLAHEIGIEELIEAGYLAPIKGVSVRTKTTLKGVGSSEGDFAEGALATRVNNPERNALAARLYKEKHMGQKTMVFAVNKAHAQELQDTFQRQGIKSAVITEDTPKEERANLKADMRSGKTEVVISVSCLDEETQILTLQGWKGYKEINGDSLVANWEHGRVTFETPRAIIIRVRGPEERMVSLKTKQFDIRVTEDHDMLARTAGKGKFQKKKAKEVVGKSFGIPVSGFADPLPVSPTQEEITRKRITQRIASAAYIYRKNGMDGKEALELARKRVLERANMKFKAPHELTLPECQFIGLWLGDGSTSRLQSGGEETTITQCSRDHEEIKEIRQILKGCGFDFKERDKTEKGINVLTWSVPRGTGFGNQKRSGKYHLEPYLVKNGTPLYWGLNVEQVEALLEGFRLAEGHHTAKETRFKQFRNTNKELLDLLQALAVCKGFRCQRGKGQEGKTKSQKRLYTVSYKKFTETQRVGEPHSKQLEFEGTWKPEKVWCVTTRTGNIITRRNGRVCVMGNCLTEGFDVPEIKAIFALRPTKSPTLLAQMLGRGMRLIWEKDETSQAWKANLDKKTDCTVYDFVDLNARKMGAKSCGDLLGLPKECDIDYNGENLSKIRAIIDLVSLNPLAAERIVAAKSAEEIRQLLFPTDLLAGIRRHKPRKDTDYPWTQGPDGHQYLGLTQGELCAITLDARGIYTLQHPSLQIGERWKRANPERKETPPKDIPGRDVSLAAKTLGAAFREAEDLLAPALRYDNTVLNHKAEWLKDASKTEATPKQKAMLEKLRLLSEPELRRVKKSEATLLLQKDRIHKGILLSKGKMPSGAYEGIDAAILAIHKPSYIEFLLRENLGGRAKELLEKSLQENPVAWIKNNKRGIFKRHLEQNEAELAEAWDSRDPKRRHDVRRAAATALASDPGLKWEDIEKIAGERKSRKAPEKKFSPGHRPFRGGKPEMGNFQR